MSYSTYFVIRQILMGLLFFFGMHMIFIPLSPRLNKSFYQRSLRIMGVAFLIVPLSCLAYTQESKLDLEPYMATAINLTAYFATFTLMSIAFLTLLGKRIHKGVIWLSIFIMILYPLPLWISIMTNNPDIISTITTVSYTCFVMIVIVTITGIIRNIKRAKKDIENYYSEDLTICINWISRSMILLIGLAFTCLLAPTFLVLPLNMRFIFMIYGVLCYIHIHYGYRHMLIQTTERFIEQQQSVINERNDETEIVISSYVMQSIQQNLDRWILEEKYHQKGININDVAKQIKTNRTYLSKYINTTFQYSFKSWITKLRIDEAKQLLSSNPEIPINNIADSIGFASIESFTHIFTRIEGMPPTKWREEHNTQPKTT